MQRNSDQAGSITWQDAMRNWYETEVHYGCHIELHKSWIERKGDRFRINACITVKRVTGTKKYKTVHQRPFEYPNRHSATFPGTLVYHLSAIALELDRQREEEARALAQMPLFSGDN